MRAPGASKLTLRARHKLTPHFFSPRVLSAHTPPKWATSDGSESDQTNELAGELRRSSTPPPPPMSATTVAQTRLASPTNGMISPPVAFRSSTSDLQRVAAPPPQPPQPPPPDSVGAANQTELTTRLTRCKFNRRAELATARSDGTLAVSERRRTLTKLDQNLVAPNFDWLLGQARRAGRRAAGGQVAAAGHVARAPSESCRFKAQVVFESDTDSAQERLSSAGGRRRAATGRGCGAPGGEPATDETKQLITETKYSLTNGAASSSQGEPKPAAAAAAGRAPQANGIANQAAPARAALAPIQPNWDYSLRVNRMRGSRVDSRVK